MIICCDPPRHALLIHFGKRSRRQFPCTVTPYQGIELALDQTGTRPKLIAIHFVRRHFYLPFISHEGRMRDYIDLRFWREYGRVCFDFRYAPENLEHLPVFEGLTVLISPAEPTGGDRPVVYGLRVDEKLLEVELDADEIRFESSADNLKDVPVTLFTHVTGQ